MFIFFLSNNIKSNRRSTVVMLPVLPMAKMASHWSPQYLGRHFRRTRDRNVYGSINMSQRLRWAPQLPY